MSAMRWWSWPSRAETSPCRSLAYLYSAFSERSPWARATLISFGSSSCSSCSSRAISSLSFFLIFSVRSIIGHLRHPGGPCLGGSPGLAWLHEEYRGFARHPANTGRRVTPPKSATRTVSGQSSKPTQEQGWRRSRGSGTRLQRLQIRFVGTGDDSKRDAHPVPAVDRADRQG